MMYEEAFFHLLNSLHAEYTVENLTLAGGCAMNSVANGKVFRETPFKRLYVQPAAGDAGGAIGAALTLWHRLNPDAPRFRMEHAYWGPSFDDDAVATVLGGHAGQLNRENCTVERATTEDELLSRTVGVIEAGGVVGWFQSV